MQFQKESKTQHQKNSICNVHEHQGESLLDKAWVWESSDLQPLIASDCPWLLTSQILAADLNMGNVTDKKVIWTR